MIILVVLYYPFSSLVDSSETIVALQPYALDIRLVGCLQLSGQAWQPGQCEVGGFTYLERMLKSLINFGLPKSLEKENNKKNNLRKIPFEQ